MARILLVDDDVATLNLLQILVSRAKTHEVVVAHNGVDGLAMVEKTPGFDVILCDVRMDPIDGLEVLKQVQAKSPSTVVIMMTAFGSVQTAVESMQQGAFDYIIKPFKMQELTETMQRALEYHQILNQSVSFAPPAEVACRIGELVAESPAMRGLCDQIERVASVDTPLLILGESGTGRGLVASAVHNGSRRQAKPFTVLDCTPGREPELAKKLFGTAKQAPLLATNAGGTLFLANLQYLPAAVQEKLSTLLQERQYAIPSTGQMAPLDVRVIASAPPNLELLVNRGIFRPDLFTRLNLLRLEVKPLRERREDIMPLFLHLLRRQVGAGGDLPPVSGDVRVVFDHYAWPGNVTEVERVVGYWAQNFRKSGRVTLDMLPESLMKAAEEMDHESVANRIVEAHRGRMAKAYLREKERKFLNDVLAEAGGDEVKAAEMLKCTVAAFRRRLQVC